MSAVMINMHGVKTTLDTVSIKSFGKLQHTWCTPAMDIQLYAKKRGRAGTENMYKFPSPVDDNIYFGDCLLINSSGGDLLIEEWDAFYTVDEEEDADEEETDEEEEEDGGILVSDNELEEEPYI